MLEMRFMSRVSVYLILKNDSGHILFARRQNTGFADGFYSLVSGHLEAGETVQQAMAREAHEEAGITVCPDDLSVVHVVQHQSGSLHYFDFYLQCAQWKGCPVNREPEKCSDLRFLPGDPLPIDVCENVHCALACIAKNQYFSHFGFVTESVLPVHKATTKCVRGPEQ